MVPLEYHASLVDMGKINEFAWDDHFFGCRIEGGEEVPIEEGGWKNWLLDRWLSADVCDNLHGFSGGASDVGF